MATASAALMLPLFYLLVVISHCCHSLDEVAYSTDEAGEYYSDVGESRHNPNLKVQRVTRQVVEDNIGMNATVLDNHNYYTVKYLGGEDAMNQWIDTEKMGASQHPRLSANSRLAATITLDFDFPFYGHNITKLLLTTGGFMYLGTYVHRYIAATQYIAPLMANFNPESSPNCSISYFSSDSLFIAEWKNIQLGDNPTAGPFSFQCILKSNGEIVFAYKDIPIPVGNISGEAHPTKMGIADAYYVDTTLTMWIKKRTIFEYHQVALNADQVYSSTAAIFSPLPTCNLHTDCESCTSRDTLFNCTWCPSAKRCSDGFDRHRQGWVQAGCEQKGKSENVPYNCPFKPKMGAPTTVAPSTMGKHPSIYTDCSEGIPCYNGGVCRYGECLCPTLYTGRRCEQYSDPTGEHRGSNAAHSGDAPPNDTVSMGLHIGTVLGSIFIICLVVAFVGWIVYAYRNPTSHSGMFLIEITRFRVRKNNTEGVGYSYHKPDDGEENIIM